MTYYVGENVTLSSDVVVAPGAVLEAAPDCHLHIEAGVCIGSGVIIQAYGGVLTLAPGVSVGQAVLIVGCGTVGARACIGAESTLVNPQIDTDQVVPARSLLLLGTAASAAPTAAPTTSSYNGNGKTPSGSPNPDPSSPPPEASPTAAAPVYGRDQVLRLVQTLFPYRAPLNPTSAEESA